MRIAQILEQAKKYHEEIGAVGRSPVSASATPLNMSSTGQDQLQTTATKADTSLSNIPEDIIHSMVDNRTVEYGTSSFESPHESVVSARETTTLTSSPHVNGSAG